MSMALFGPLLALAGILIGAYLARNRENEKARRDRRVAVYAKYLDVSSASSTPVMALINGKLMRGEALTADELVALNANRVDFINAHSNIVVYGSKTVIAALSAFYDVAAQSGPDQQAAVNTAMIALITAMRHDGDAEDYPEFGAHVDNIIGARADMRGAMMMQRQAQMQGGGQ